MLHVESNTFLSSLHCLVTFSTEHCYSNSATLASIMCDCHVWHFPKLCKATPKSCVTHALSTYVRLRLSHAWHLSQSCMALASAEVLHNLNHSLLFFFGSSFFFSLSSSFFHPPPPPFKFLVWQMPVCPKGCHAPAQSCVALPQSQMYQTSWVMHGTCLSHVWHLPQSCVALASVMCGTSLSHAWHLPQSCVAVPSVMCNTCFSHV